MKMFYLQKNKGFTLVETIVYVAIFSMFVGGLSIFTLSLNSSRLRAQILLEVNGQGSSVVRTITQTIRNGLSINTPNIGNSGGTLSVSTGDPATNPTVFSVTGDTLFIKEGAGSPVALTNNKVKVTNLAFTNLSRSVTSEAVQIRFTLSNTDFAAKEEQQYSVDFYGSASIR